MMMTDYKRSINALKFEGISYRTFINDDANMVIRYNEFDKNYTDEIYDATGKLLCVIDFEDGNMHIQNKKHCVDYLNGYTGEIYNTHKEALTAFENGDRVCTWCDDLNLYFDWATSKFYTINEWYEIIDEYIEQEVMCN